MTARVLAFEDMTYESGVGFTNPPKFRLASPEKSVNGFPIQLDSIAFVNHNGNPGLYLRPKLVMNGDANGFSAFLGMIFYSCLLYTSTQQKYAAGSSLNCRRISNILQSRYSPKVE